MSKPAGKNMSWTSDGMSFLDAHPIEEDEPENQQGMFGRDTTKNVTASMARQSALAKLEADSNAALAELKSGVRVSAFIPTLRKVAAFKQNEDDEQVSIFVEKLAEICGRVSAVEAKVLVLEEQVTRYSILINVKNI
jgi:predicted RNA binding protein with dsRBD fold (UPF0201 family)